MVRRLLLKESDKTSFDVPAPVDGKIVETFVDPGQMVSVGDVICVLENRPKSNITSFLTIWEAYHPL